MRLSLEVYTPNLKPQNLTPFTGRSLNDTSCPMMMTPFNRMPLGVKVGPGSDFPAHRRVPYSGFAEGSGLLRV